MSEAQLDAASILFSVEELVEFKVLDPKLDCLVCFRPLAEHEEVCVPIDLPGAGSGVWVMVNVSRKRTL